MDLLRVLLVEPQPEEAESMARWLREAGHEVSVCPGPIQPDYSCAGLGPRGCPLLYSADVVILDASLESDLQMEGVGAADLLALYGARRKPVVLVSHWGSEAAAFLDDGVIEFRWPVDRDALVAAVESLVGRRSHTAA